MATDQFRGIGLRGRYSRRAARCDSDRSSILADLCSPCWILLTDGALAWNPRARRRKLTPSRTTRHRVISPTGVLENLPHRLKGLALRQCNNYIIQKEGSSELRRSHLSNRVRDKPEADIIFYTAIFSTLSTPHSVVQQS